MRCATVASASRKALAISVVVNPTTARSVKATCASCDSAGWQHVKISLSRSSASAGSGRKSERSSSTSFSRYRLSRRRMSMARRRAVVINHAPGLSGIPCSGHVSSAATGLSWVTSGGRWKWARAGTRGAGSRPASSRKTAATATSAGVRVCSAVLGGVREPSGFRLLHLSGVVDHRPHFDRARRPGLGHGERLVEILDLDDREATDDLLRLDIRPVGDDGLAVLDAHGRPVARPLELFAADQPAGPALLFEPFVCPLVGSGTPRGGQPVKRILVVGATHEHQHVFHSESLPSGRSWLPLHLDDERVAPKSTGYLPVYSGSCLARKLMMPMAASSLRAVRAKLRASISNASSSGRS